MINKKQIVNQKATYNYKFLKELERLRNNYASDMNKRQHGMMKCVYCGKKLKRLSSKYNATRYVNSNNYAFSNCHRRCFEEQRGKD